MDHIIWFNYVDSTLKVKTVMECSRTSCELCDYPYGNVLLHRKKSFGIWTKPQIFGLDIQTRQRTEKDINITYKPFHKWSFTKISRPKLRRFQRLLFKTILCILFLLISPILCYSAHLSRQRSRANYEKEYSSGSELDNILECMIKDGQFHLTPTTSHFLYKFSGRIAAICFIDCVIIVYCYKMCRYFR